MLESVDLSRSFDGRCDSSGLLLLLALLDLVKFLCLHHFDDGLRTIMHALVLELLSDHVLLSALLHPFDGLACSLHHCHALHRCTTHAKGSL